MERPSAIFCYGKHSILNDFCYTEFSAYHTGELYHIKSHPENMSQLN